MKPVLRTIARTAALAGAAALLAACVYQPPPAPGYGYYGAPGYYAAPGYYSYYPPVVGSVSLGFGWGGGWHRHWR